VETLRPLVEDILSQEDLCQMIAEECDLLKSLPLGSHILRCIGRAYRHAGQRALRRYHRRQRLINRRRNRSRHGSIIHSSIISSISVPVPLVALQAGLDDFSDDIRDVLRNARQVATAAMASGKLVYTEQRATQSKHALGKNAWRDGLSFSSTTAAEAMASASPSSIYTNHQQAQQQQEQQQHDMAQVDQMFHDDNQMHDISVHEDDDDDDDTTKDDVLGHVPFVVPEADISIDGHDDSSSHSYSSSSSSSSLEVDTLDILRHKEHLKSQKAVLRTLEVEALWKIYKIELDRTVGEACRLILSGNYFFFPSHANANNANTSNNNANHHHHGTRSSTGRGGRQRSGEYPSYRNRNDDGGDYQYSNDNDTHNTHPAAHLDGWVSPYSGQVIDTKVGRLRAAAAMVMIGDILVQCSKEGTSWKNKE
jgi:hypothetical protein